MPFGFHAMLRLGQHVYANDSLLSARCSITSHEIEIAKKPTPLRCGKEHILLHEDIVHIRKSASM